MAMKGLELMGFEPWPPEPVVEEGHELDN